MYLGRYPSLEELGREPTGMQRAIIQRLRALLAVCGSSPEPFSLAPGRSGPELVACLLQLEHFAQRSPEMQQPYLKQPTKFREDPSLLPVDSYPQLAPYRSLDASRLKLVGEGKWRMSDFLSGPLWLPFLEPAFLRHGLPVDESCAPNFKQESRAECFELMKVWDAKGLLEFFPGPADDGMFCRVFNAFKNPSTDRQIGDRRRVNMAERSYDGPSKFLPPGPLLVQLRVQRHREQLIASVTDRRDFYHQASVSIERAQTNLLPFSFDRSEVLGFAALESFDRRAQTAMPKQREVAGDRLGFAPEVGAKKRHEGPLFAGFSSLFQGDHLGVEFALCAHQTLLEEGGLLSESNQIRGHHGFPLGPIYTGLVIDDFFVIGREPLGTQPLHTVAATALARARDLYDREGLVGSVEKDVEACARFKAAGAEVISDESAVRSGFVVVGSPVAKRLALACLSLRAAALSGLSPNLACRLAGNWTSALLYRRCLSSVVDGLFALGAASESKPPDCIVPLPRSVSRELVVLSALAPLMCSNVAVNYHDRMFATDASLNKGAVVEACVSPEVCEEVWLDSDKKGCYVELDSGFREMLRHIGEFDGDEVPTPAFVRPKASPLLYFDFVEICGGVGAVSDAAIGIGLVVAPPLDLSASRHYDLTDLRLLEWILHMVAEGRFRSFLIEPPCTSFSPAAFPCVRSYKLPYGFCRENPKVMHGNCLAFRSLIIMRAGRRHRRPCGLEQPRRSKMAWLREWFSLVQSGAFSEAILAACQFGSIHQKEFRFLLHLIAVADVERRCTRDHPHVQIQGKYTKKSAIYTPEMGCHLAAAFKKALRMQVHAEEPDWKLDGLESVVSNDLMLAAKWNEVESWVWKRSPHINVLEVSAAVRVLAKHGVRFPHTRFLSFLDSAVAKGALSKGRSTSRLLQPLLRRAAALQIVFDLYPVWPFCPTRLNVADDPTRDCCLREPSPGTIRKAEGVDFRALHRVGLKRSAANWIRLVLLVSACVPGNATCVSSHFPLGSWSVDALWIAGRLLELLRCIFVVVSFGLVWFLLLRCLLRLWISRANLLSVGLMLSAGPAFAFPPLDFGLGAHAMEPSSLAERKRAEMRTSIKLTGDRVILDFTRARRKKLLKQFQVWLWQTRGVSLLYMLKEKPADPEKIAHWLTQYGRELFRSGKAYGIFAETINSVAAARPQVRKQLTTAWDFAFSWIADEPFSHHPAMPASVLLALLSVALVWGWVTEAAVLGLAWAGILRIGEALQATRSDLVLPRDAAPGTRHALLRIREPKTRGRHARHQAARIDPADIIQLLDIAFARLDATAKLWPLSACTLRKRFNDLMRAAKLPDGSSGDRARAFDLSSLRPGGASHLLNACEDSEMVRRRGRWATVKTMEIYLQEVLYVTYVEKLPQATKEFISIAAAGFPDVLQQAQTFTEAGVPPTAWFLLLKGRPVNVGENG